MGSVADIISNSNSFISDEDDEFEILLLNGANLALVGNEIIQFKTAQFLEEGRYKIKSLLRGRLGTENRMENHSLGERFILLNGLVLRAAMPSHLIGLNIYIKAVSFLQNIKDIEPISISYRAQNLVPYAVANFQATKDSGSGDISFSWQRRSRQVSAWRDFVDVPLAESSESYLIEIINNYGQVVRSIYSNINSAIYTLSEQIIDFGLSQNSIKTIVYQLSEVVGKGEFTEKTFNF